VADANATPRSIPDSIIPPEPVPERRPEPPQTAAAKPQAGARSTAQVFDTQQKAIQAEGSGLFDTKGFPLGDYAEAIIQRIKGNWYIPSNLRNSQGRTTVIFFIGKDGRYTNAHIVTSSGSTSLDLAALNAVLVSNPFPPLPSGFPGERVGAKFVFSYNERQ
jgi:TonB family protein